MPHPLRKKHFIDRHVQGSLVRRMILHWMTFLSVAFFVSFVLQVLSNPFRPMGEHLQNLWWTHGPFLLVVAFLLPAYVVDTIKLSHRFAGPIFSLRRALTEVASGAKARRLKFRANDYWKDLADQYNAVLERFGAFDESQPEKGPAEQNKTPVEAVT